MALNELRLDFVIPTCRCDASFSGEENEEDNEDDKNGEGEAYDDKNSEHKRENEEDGDKEPWSWRQMLAAMAAGHLSLILGCLPPPVVSSASRVRPLQAVTTTNATTIAFPRAFVSSTCISSAALRAAQTSS